MAYLSRCDLSRYSKRPLRGPYGQMLEAEMAKPRTADISLEEGLRPRRKVSANLSYNTSSNNSGSEPPTPCHHRTTSSPSKLEGLPGPSPELLAELLRGSSERVARAPVHRNVSTIEFNMRYFETPYSREGSGTRRIGGTESGVTRCETSQIPRCYANPDK